MTTTHDKMRTMAIDTLQLAGPGVLDAFIGYIDANERTGRELAAASKKWLDYELEYILPCFRWAKECGIDLPALVAEAKGNCVARLVGALREKLQAATERAETAERENEATTAELVIYAARVGDLEAENERLKRELLLATSDASSAATKINEW